MSVHDGPLDADVHWQVLWSQLTTPDTVLLAHLEGHYSLVFAAREWTAGRLLEDVSGKHRSIIQLASTLRHRAARIMWCQQDFPSNPLTSMASGAHCVHQTYAQILAKIQVEVVLQQHENVVWSSSSSSETDCKVDMHMAAWL